MTDYAGVHYIDTTSAGQVFEVWLWPLYELLAPGDVTEPTVELVSPLTAHLGKFTDIVVDIDDDQGIRTYFVYAYWADALLPAEIVYAPTNPRVVTNYKVTAAEVGGKLRLTIRRKAGWYAPPRLCVIVIDTSGNQA